MGGIILSFLISFSTLVRASSESSFALQLLFKLGDFGLPVIGIADFLLNGAHLLVQVIVLLGFLHLPLDAVLDALLGADDLHGAFHDGIDPLKALADIGRLKHLLLIGKAAC